MINPRNLCLFLALLHASAFADLQHDAKQIIRNASLNQGNASVAIFDTQTQSFIAEIESNNSMIPASNQKLITTGSALHILGPSFEFSTKIIQDKSTFTIVGDGDPSLGDIELHPQLSWQQELAFLNNELDEWAKHIESSGVRKIDNLYVDDRIFDREFTHPSWPENQINNWYCAQVAGINYHLNVLHFYPFPISGSNANLEAIAPAMDWIKIKNKTSSKTSKNDKSSFWVSRLPNSNTMTAHGNVKAKHTEPIKVAFHDPPIVFANLLASRLRKMGVQVQHIARIPTNLEISGNVIFEKKTPISNALNRANTNSHNMYAEALFKRTAAGAGYKGTFKSGTSVIDKIVRQRIGEQHTIVAADGSGMSRENKLTAHSLALWLASFNLKEPAGLKLLDSLATPGQGTLKNRFLDIDFSKATVHGKSGYLRGVCTLSGYITFENRLPIVFSILVNDVIGTVKGAKKMQEELILATIDYVINN